MAKNDDEDASGYADIWEKVVIAAAFIMAAAMATMIFRGQASVSVLRASPSKPAPQQTVAPPAYPGEVEAFIVPSAPKAPAAPVKKN